LLFLSSPANEAPRFCHNGTRSKRLKASMFLGRTVAKRNFCGTVFVLVFPTAPVEADQHERSIRAAQRLSPVLSYRACFRDFLLALDAAGAARNDLRLAAL
jgi:hypothetical protein